jgi:hypothetical protein
MADLTDSQIIAFIIAFFAVAYGIVWYGNLKLIEQGKRKHCPHCREVIDGKATACKHCGRDV